MHDTTRNSQLDVKVFRAYFIPCDLELFDLLTPKAEAYIFIPKCNNAVTLINIHLVLIKVLCLCNVLDALTQAHMGGQIHKKSKKQWVTSLFDLAYC